VRQIPYWLRAALLALLGLGVLSAAWNASSGAALAYSLADVALIALPVTAVLCVATCRDVAAMAFDRVVSGVLILTALAVGSQEVVGVFAVRDIGLEFDFYIALPNFHFPRFYNQMQSWMMPATIAAVLVFPGRRLVVVLVACALALHWYVVLATGARGTALGVTLATGFCAVAFPQLRWQILRYQGVGLLAGLALFAALVATAGPSAAPGAATTSPVAETTQLPSDPHGDSLAGALSGNRMWTSTGRIGLWRAAVRHAGEQPLLGIGPGNYACKGWPTRSAHPHSFPLQILAEWGVPAFAVLLVIAAYLAWAALCRLRATVPDSHSPGVAGILFSAVLAAAIHACFSGVLLMPASQLTGVLIGGWLLAAVRERQQVHTVQGSRSTSLILTLALAAAVALAAFGWRDHAVRQQRFENSPAWGLAIPRFWHNGKVCGVYQRTPGPEAHQ
jgi:O-antigen ligase